jgi:hypothetical protein
MDSIDTIRFGLEIAGIMLIALLGGCILYVRKNSRDSDRLD